MRTGHDSHGPVQNEDVGLVHKVFRISRWRPQRKMQGGLRRGAREASPTGAALAAVSINICSMHECLEKLKKRIYEGE